MKKIATATCPFCGEVCKEYSHRGAWNWEITCTNPSCEIRPWGLFKSRKNALMAWNTRIDIEESAEIKQCPFCGVPGHLRKFVGWNEKYGLTWAVACTNPLCKIHPTTQLSQTPKNAIENWNKRSL